MHALVTGCAGFIGSRLSARLLDQGNRVTGLDCFTPYYDREAKQANLLSLTDRSSFTFREMDLRSEDLTGVARVDVVFHLAAQPGVRASWGESFTDYLGHNILATQRLLEACATTGLPRLIFASSSSVYGDAERHPTPEDAACRPVSPYGVTKLACEYLIGAYASGLGIKATMLRYFTVYGPGQRPDMAFHRFIRAILEGRSIEVFGDGEQTRDVTYVDDAVRATMAAAEAPEGYGPVNVGGGSRVSVNEVIGLLGEIIGTEPNVVRGARARGDVRHTSADLGRARELLDYRPVVEIEQGLREEVSWLRGRRGTQGA